MYRAISIFTIKKPNFSNFQAISVDRSNFLKLFFTSNRINPHLLISKSYLRKISFTFSSQYQKYHHDYRNHQNVHSQTNHHGQDPIIKMRKQLQKISQQIQQKYQDSPQQVIKQLYHQCQVFVGENRKVQILMLFEIICEFIQSKNLVQKYSSFMIMSAGNSFLMGKYQEVYNRCKLALPHEIKKHGQKHKNVADIYNMLGISISKGRLGKGQEALSYLEKAFKIRRDLFGQSAQTAEVLFNTGIVEQEVQKMLQRAQENYLDSIQMLQNCNIPSPLIYVKAKMRLSEVQYKIHQTSTKYISDMLRVKEFVQNFKNQDKFQKNQKGNIDLILSLLHKNLGKKLLYSNQNAQAINYFDQCLVYLRENKIQTQDRIQVLQSCAIAYVNLQQFDKAAKLLEQAEIFLNNLPTTQQYKYRLWKFLSQVYRKTGQLQKQKSILERMKIVLKNSKEEFVQPIEILDTEISLIYCLGNLKDFDKVIEIGQQSLETIDTYKSLQKSQYNDYKSNISAYVGFAYLSKGQADISLGYFQNSDKIFSQTEFNPNRYEFHSKILRKIALIYIQIKKDFHKGMLYLNKCLKLIQQNKDLVAQKKINDLVVLLIDYEIQAIQNDAELVNRLIDANYIEKINEVIEQIVKLSRQIADIPQGKTILANYYVLIQSIYQIYLSFTNLSLQNDRIKAVLKTSSQLRQLIQVYDNVFQTQIDQLLSNTFKGDEALGQSIKKSLKVKEILKK